MRTISVDQARMELPQVFDEVEAGGEIIIARGGKPIARGSLACFKLGAKHKKPRHERGSKGERYNLSQRELTSS